MCLNALPVWNKHYWKFLGYSRIYLSDTSFHSRWKLMVTYQPKREFNCLQHLGWWTTGNLLMKRVNSLSSGVNDYDIYMYNFQTHYVTIWYQGSDQYCIYIYVKSCDVVNHLYHNFNRRVAKRPLELGHGPLARYVKLRVAHAPGMPGTFSPPPTSKKTAS